MIITQIVELYEKNTRLKNKTVDITFTTNQLQAMFEIIDLKIKDIKDKIQSEIEEIFNQEYFEERNSLNRVLYKIDDAILQKRTTITLSYEELETLNKVIEESINKLSRTIKKWGKTLNKDIYEKLQFFIKIHIIVKEEYEKAVFKIYPKRNKINIAISDYLEECKYNNSFLESDISFTIIFDIKEKEDIINIFALYLTNTENNDVVYNPEDEPEMQILIDKNDLVLTLEKVLKELEKNIFGETQIKINMKEYYIIKYITTQR